MKSFRHLPLSTRLSVPALLGLLVGVPLFSRYSMGWLDASGAISDLAIGVLLALLLFNRSRLLLAAVLLAWAAMQLGTAELVSAVGRMPEPGDLRYLEWLDSQQANGAARRALWSLALESSPDNLLIRSKLEATR